MLREPGKPQIWTLQIHDFLSSRTRRGGISWGIIGKRGEGGAVGGDTGHGSISECPLEKKKEQGRYHFY